MANKTIPMKRLRSVLRMYADKYSKKTIAKTLKLSRNTVRKYITTYESMSLTIEDLETKSDQELSAIFHPPEANKPKKTSRLDNLIAFFPYMNKEIKKTGVTREILWNEYRELHPDGYQKIQFNEYYNRWNKRVNPVMRIDHKAGENLYIDFAGKKLHLSTYPMKSSNFEDFWTVIQVVISYSLFETSQIQILYKRNIEEINNAKLAKLRITYLLIFENFDIRIL